jgi:hypothetical protein
LRTLDRQEFYTAKEQALTVILQRCHAISRELKNQYVQEWAEVLGDYRKLSIMNNKKLFQEDIWRRVQEQDPVLASMLRYELVYVLLRETKPMKEVYYEAQRILNEKQGTLIPIDEILRLEQKRLITEARTYLPLWKSIPLIGRLGVYLGKLFSSFGKRGERRAEKKAKKESAGSAGGGRDRGRERGERSAAASTAGSSGKGGGAMMMGSPGSSGGNDRRKEEIQRRREYRKAMEELTSQYVDSGRDIDETLEELIEEWNPLVESQAKQDLVEDVNAAVRDFLRKIRRKMVTPPDRARIQNLASQIAEYQAFNRIKQKRAFQRYIELYMIKLLGQ